MYVLRRWGPAFVPVHVDNEAGIELYRKFGFEIEGTHRRFALRNGAYVDAYSMEYA